MDSVQELVGLGLDRRHKVCVVKVKNTQHFFLNFVVFSCLQIDIGEDVFIVEVHFVELREIILGWLVARALCGR